MGKNIQLQHGSVVLPTFLPDATFGVVRYLDPQDLIRCQVDALVMNTFHLMQKPGSTSIRSLGGIHKMTGWNRPIVTDSGGFQAFSLIHNNPKNGSLTDRGIIFRPEGNSDRILLTPEKTIQLQLSYGADIVICLDDCTHPDAPFEAQELSVKRTITWAKRCKMEFNRLISEKKVRSNEKPSLFAVVQGGRSIELRRNCAEALLDIGFDGYGYGGWPIDNQGNLIVEMLSLVRQLIPKEYPLHALGVGHPRNIVLGSKLGWDLFDSSLPTRDARKGRLFAMKEDRFNPDYLNNSDWFDYVYIGDKKYIKENKPVFNSCDCFCCQHFSLGYLHHLFKIEDGLFYRLATIHNLRFMTKLCEVIRSECHEDH